jgi:hypothetical protein
LWPEKHGKGELIERICRVEIINSAFARNDRKPVYYKQAKIKVRTKKKENSHAMMNCQIVSKI